jgi:hypothetical protein
MPAWEYTSSTIRPGESRYDELRRMGADRWEAWHMTNTPDGWWEIYFKRPQER